jgi:mono/diheme cytochrome c family protein
LPNFPFPSFQFLRFQFPGFRQFAPRLFRFAAPKGSLTLLVLLLLAGLGAKAPTRVAASDEFFEQKIRPLLAAHCLECHGGDARKRQANLRLDSRAGWMQGGDSGSAIVPGEPDRSLLIAAVRHADSAPRMPPKGKLNAAQIADLETWVKNGAVDPRQVPAADGGTGGPLAKAPLTIAQGREFWSFRPLSNPPVPSVRSTDWPRNSIDNFLMARWETAGLVPSADADPGTLLRRAAFDLTGLPPEPSLREAFLASPTPQAFAAAVDQLLESPRYGERWGRHWLDVVRYADTSGNASDYPVPQAHRYRDWVVRSVQLDMPYNEFLRRQIAGDLLPASTPAERQENLIATGYLAIARRFGGSRFGEHHLTIEDAIDNLGKAVLGATVACARCHDHKFDPFTMRDYYALYGIFESTRFPFPGAEADKKQADFVALMSPEEIERLVAPHREKLAMLDAEIKQREMAEAEAKKLPDGPDKKSALDAASAQLAESRKRRAAAANEAPVPEDAYAVADGKAANTRLQLRGDPKRLGDEVPRRFLEVLGGQPLPPESPGSGRRELAEWLVDPANPLPARVFVNRVWLHHFGRGIVATPNDFGVRGQPPTHPELLDHLATAFIRDGWSLKALHRRILLSRTWQLTSQPDATPEMLANAAKDPTNELGWRFERRRLDAEAIRDTLLWVGGELDESPAGSHPFPPRHTWGWTQHNPFVAVYESNRRSLYLMQSRLKRHPYLALFDGADPSSSTGSRSPSTTPLQALFALNDPLAHRTAANLAARALQAGSDAPTRVDAASRLVWSRSAKPEEIADCVAFLAAYRQRFAPADDRQAWSALARAMLASNEFLYLD